jgi:transmembrane sensor
MEHRNIKHSFETADLIAGYLQSALSDPQKEALFNWATASEKNRKLFAEILNEQNFEQYLAEFAAYDSRLALVKFKSEKVAVKKRAWSVRPWSGISVAAALLLTVSFGFWAYQQQQPVRQLAIATQTGTMKKIVLPDGTKVLLNAQGTLRYPEEFRDSVRDVFLSGEAYFEVTHTGQPFQIHSGKLTTRVLGTSFVVKSYPHDRQSKVMVITGRVSVKHSGIKTGVILTPGQEVTSSGNDSGLRVRKDVDGLTAMAWIKNKLSYRQSPLSEVIDDLRRRYGIRINVDEHLLQCLIYADVAPGDEPQFILDQLAVSLNGRAFKESNKTYRLTGTGCNN